MQSHWYLDEVYGHWPRWAALLRYSFSWSQRILGLTAGCGILLHRELFRRLALVIACFTISTVYWKHPYAAYYLHTKRVMAQTNILFVQNGLPAIPFQSLVMPAMILNCLLDIGFCLWLIHYFTRPEVIAQFKNNGRTDGPAV